MLLLPTNKGVTMELLAACKTYWQDSDGDSSIETVEVLETFSAEEVSVRITWPNEVSDWKLTLDEDGTVLDAYNFNTVAEY
jgi:hypothetical protein